MKDGLKIKGRAVLTLFDENGVIKRKIKLENLVVTNGEYYVANKMTGNTVQPLDYLGVGSGTTAASSSDTGLENELSRTAFSSGPTQGTGLDQDKINISASFAAGDGTGSITEAALFYGNTTLFSRVVFAPVVKGATDALLVTWEIEIVG